MNEFKNQYLWLIGSIGRIYVRDKVGVLRSELVHIYFEVSTHSAQVLDSTYNSGQG